MRPRTLRELTELARDEMAPTEEERSRVYDSLRVAVAAGAAGAGLAAAASASAAVSTSAATSAAVSTSAATSAASSTAVVTGAAAQGSALAAGAVQAGGTFAASSGLLLKGLVLLVAVSGGAGLMISADEDEAAEHMHSATTEETIPLRRETDERIETAAEAPLVAPLQELGVQETSPTSRSRRSPAARSRPAERATQEQRSPDADEGEVPTVDTALTRAARRLQRAQRAMARGDGAATLALLAEEGDPRLRAERLALRVLALCQVGDEAAARREAHELRVLDGPRSAALARISSSCVGP